ncbi:MAG: hypothetical protein KKA34_03195 [Candidatus Omnitrophica bacterium]|nr:hypothetical protein [Candidatus Omnitrophota bacterium]
MPGQSIISYIKQLRRPVFTTHELTVLSGKSQSNVTQALNFLKRQGLIIKIYRGIWAEAGNERLSPYSVIPHLFPRRRAYVSFISALHLCGIIEQIPQEITLASTGHTKIMRTKAGIFSVHRISPLFFDGFDWYKGRGSFLIAEPEKALVDSLYLSACKGRLFSYFPELHFPKSFSLKKAKAWAEKIPNPKISSHVRRKLAVL